MAVLVADFAVDTGFDRHVHTDHQLAWAAHGVLTISTDAGRWVLPSSRALWVPARVPHEVRAPGRAVMRTLYIDPARCPIRWEQPAAVAASALLAGLIARLEDPSLPAAQRRRTEAVVFDLLIPVAVGTVRVPMPRDARAAQVARRLLASPADRRGRRPGRPACAAGRQRRVGGVLGPRAGVLDQQPGPRRDRGRCRGRFGPVVARRAVLANGGGQDRSGRRHAAVSLVSGANASHAKVRQP